MKTIFRNLLILSAMAAVLTLASCASDYSLTSNYCGGNHYHYSKGWK